MQNLVAFLYNYNKVSESKIRKIVPFTVVSKIIKYSEINITKKVKSCNWKALRH